MVENIELKSFSNNFESDNSIEEYHEIDEEVFNKYKNTSRNERVKISEEDFFTQYEVDSVNKKPRNIKNSKKTERSTNLMDIINSELACMTLPVSEKLVTTTIDYSPAQQNIYLKNPGIRNYFKKPFCFSPENGYGDKLLTADLSPVYPNVLESTREYQHIPVQYKEAVKFENVTIADPEEKSSKFLDFTIKNIRFKHHHDFSLEELLSNKLVECYNEYNANEKLLSELLQDIKVTRETRDGLEEDILKISAKKENIRFDETIRKYSLKLFQLKDKYSENIGLRNKWMHKIGSLWSDIIMVREKAKFTKSPYILDIEKTEKHSDDFQKEWMKTFNTEYADKLNRLEYDFVTAYIEYKKAKNNETKAKIAKPKLKLDEENLKIEAEAFASKMVTKDEIKMILRRDDKIISNVKKSRISEPKSYFFKIYVDDVFVCESETYETDLNNKFNVDFTESFSIQIFNRNNTISIELYDQRVPVTYLKFHLNNIKGTSINADLKTEMFVYNNIVEPNLKHVGSGYNIKEIATANKVRLKSSNLFKGNLYTTCEVSLKLGWNNKFSENEMESIKSSMEIEKKLNRLMHGVEKPNIDLLKELIENIYDREVGNDEDVTNILNSISQTNTCISVDDMIPIEEDSPEFVRLKLLHLRNNGGFTNVENKTVPLLASQISTEQLNCLQMSTEAEFDGQYYDRQDMDPIEVQRYIGAKYVEKLNKNMLRNLSEHLLKRTHKDVVRDFKDLNLRGLFSSRSTLALSLSSSMRQQRLIESLGQEQEIRVTVFRAFGLRDRSTVVTDNDEDDDDEKIAGFKVKPLRPFVRVSYQKLSAQTACAIGCHPSWNQTLKIKTKLTPLSAIQVHVFDEVRSTVTDSSDRSFGILHYRCENKWLGCLQVPVKTVLDMGMLKGTLKLSSPPVILGYESTTKSSHSLIPEVTQLMRKEAAFVSVQITTSLSHLGGGQGYYQPIPSDPDDHIIHHLNTFVTEYINEFPSRNISLTFIDSTGRNKSVTHFLQPIPPPDYEFFPKNPKSGSAMSKSSGFSSSSRRREEERSEGSVYSGFSGKGDGLSRMVDACLRYVALIPCYEVAESHVVTLLGVELLKVLHGSPVDHTILLASYFLHLGLKCYVAAGFGLPRGLSYYVLTKYDLTTRRLVLANDQYRSRGLFSRSEGFVWYVYDAVSGERFELRDVSCPLKSVNYVFDSDNIWVNMQSSVDCESVSFDFSKSSDWKPAFDKSIFIMKLPVVTDPCLYSGPMEVTNLRSALEAKIKSKVQQWRPHVKTIWNRYCSTLLREVLPFWEYHSFNPSEQKPGLGQRLKQLILTHKLFGFPINLPYTNTRAILARVRPSCLHVSGPPNAELALGVDAFAYPNGVVSVWVFLATVTRV